MTLYSADVECSGFPYRYIRWIMGCLSNVTYVVNVNGELTEPFEAKKGLR